MAAHGAEHGGGDEHHKEAHHKPHVEHGAGHGDAHGTHEKKGGKEGFFNMVGKRLREVTSIMALFSLSMMVSENFVKPIAFETAKGTMETPARIVAAGASKVGPSGGGGDHGHGGGGHTTHN